MNRATWIVLAVVGMLAAACSSPPAGSMIEMQRAKAGAFDVVLLSPSGVLPQGKGFAILEFHDASGSLVDVGAVKVNATMVMAGMAPMIAGSEVKPTPAPGRYEMATDFSMAGTWQLAVE